MIIKLRRIYELAEDFQNENPDDAWENLFDYLNRVGFRNCYSNEDELSDYFSKYMHQYRMYRNTKLTKDKLLAILRHGKKIYIEYLCNYNEDNFIKVWAETHSYLKTIGVSSSRVMITKLLMGFGGRTPAYDSQFIATICDNPAFLLYGVGFLTEKLKKGGFSQLKTHKDKNIIPWERILDMAFWHANNKNEKYLIE